MSTLDNSHEFPLRQAHELVRDLMTPNPWIYWTDFLFSISLGWAAFFTALNSPLLSFWQTAAYVVASLALYRSAIFIHELAHLKKDTFRSFRLVWNIICGIPLLVPSFSYDGVHNDHHKPDVYGTSLDGEYVPFAIQKPSGIIGYVMLSFLIPALFLIRFLVLTPLSYFIPPLRRFLWKRASSLTIDMNYVRPQNAIKNDRHWKVQEFFTFLYIAAIAGATLSGIMSYRFLLLWYLIAVFVFFLNSLRTLAAHAYRNPGDHKMAFPDQYLDSINIPGNFLTGLWAPVGLRYHATHHLFMSMPYHNLGKAHRRLTEKLENNTLYLYTLRQGLWDALQRIWQESSTSSAHR